MSIVAIAGGHGKIALLLGQLLAERGDTVRGLIRNPDQEDDLRAVGIEPVVCDLEGDGDVASAVRSADAVIFAAGAGPGSGAARKTTMDLEGAVKLIDAAKAAGISRYLMVSAMGAADPPAEGGGGDDVFSAYLRAKAGADAALRASGLDYTIVRPGGLTDGPGTGLVSIAERLDRGQVPRADVAAVFIACLDVPGTIGKSFDLIGGETPIAEALAALPG
ncbi:MAG TPA: SDR family oxidoreductase [Solirubrobacterales bacterium]|nr:SDR family oxidoreductase [Solirubrobacterales bacterium]